MSDRFDNDYWQRYGIFEEEDMEDVRSARKIGRYGGNALVLSEDDPLSLEWRMWDELYG